MMPLVIYSRTHIRTYPHESDFKKPGARRPVAGVHQVQKRQLYVHYAIHNNYTH